MKKLTTGAADLPLATQSVPGSVRAQHPSILILRSGLPCCSSARDSDCSMYFSQCIWMFLQMEWSTIHASYKIARVRLTKGVLRCRTWLIQDLKWIHGLWLCHNTDDLTSPNPIVKQYWRRWGGRSMSGKPDRLDTTSSFILGLELFKLVPHSWWSATWSYEWVSESRSVVSDSLWPHSPYSPWNSPGQNTGVGSLFLPQGIFPTQGLNRGLLHFGPILCQLSHIMWPWANHSLLSLTICPTG